VISAEIEINYLFFIFLCAAQNFKNCLFYKEILLTLIMYVNNNDNNRFYDKYNG